MTQEEKAIAYDEAIERARKIHNEHRAQSFDVMLKVFPELAESKDEKIRKALIEMVHDTTGDSLWVDYNIHKEDALAWLERRGQTFTKKDVDDAYLKGVCDTKHELEKQGEQNHAWSEEDEWKFSDILALLRGGENCHYNTPDLFDWFKSLKDRVQPIPKQEWGDEDERIIEDVETWLDTLCEYLKDSSSECIPVIKELISKLKSLRPQNMWKPSDEQLKALLSTLPIIKGHGNSVQSILETLYDDLKKLREE